MALSVLAVLFFLGLARAQRGMAAEPDYPKALAAGTPLPLALAALLCALMLYGAFLTWRYGVGAGASDLFSRLLAVFAALSGVSCLVLALAVCRRRGGNETALASFVIVLFLCFWLILRYKETAADPTLLRFAYGLLGLAMAAVAAYYLAGYAFGRSRVCATLFFSMTGVYFSLAAPPSASARSLCCIC